MLTVPTLLLTVRNRPGFRFSTLMWFCSQLFCFFFSFKFRTAFCCLAQADLELMAVLLPLASGYWDYGYSPLCLTHIRMLKP